MRRRQLLLLLLLLVSPSLAVAVPVRVSVEPWRTVDGNFAFSVLHSASGGVMTRGGMDFHTGGPVEHGFSHPRQLLDGDLTDSVLSLEAGSLQLDGGVVFDVRHSVLDFRVSPGSRIGSIGYDLVDGGSIESGAFHFYAFDFTDGACDANGLCLEGEYRLWGNNWENAAGPPPIGNVLLDGVLATRHRGIDLWGRVSPAVPEPGAALLFGLGTIVVGHATRRRGYA